MRDFPACPPVVQFGVDRLFEQGALEPTSGELSLDRCIDPVRPVSTHLLWHGERYLPVPDSGYSSHKVRLDELGVIEETSDVASRVADSTSAIDDEQLEKSLL